MVDSQIVKTLSQALEYLDQGTYRIVAGGTDMLVQNRSHTGMPIGFKQAVLYVSHIDELNYIKEDDDHIYIGATTPLETILNSRISPKLIKDIFIEMASPAIRHTGTLAGNICNASPAGDSLPALYLYDSLVKIQSLGQTRVCPISEFIQGVRKIDLKQNEMVTEVIIPKYNQLKTRFVKVAPRLSDAISKLSFAGGILVEDGLVKDFRIALGAVYMTVVRDPLIENKYINKSVIDFKYSVEDILKDYEGLIRPIDDQRSNKVYRKKVALNLIKDFVLNI